MFPTATCINACGIGKFHTLKQGRNGVCFEQQPVGNVVYWLGILLPQHHQNEI